MIRLGNKYSEGLVHKIYLKEGDIFKVTKDNFPDFNTKTHFELEKNVLSHLKKFKLPSADVIKIFKIGNKFVLQEKFIKGYQKKKGELSRKEIQQILDYIKKAHEIKLNGYGPIKKDLRGTYSSWTEFIEQIEDNARYLIKNKLIDNEFAEKISKLVELNKEDLIFIDKGSLILTDVNPTNFFFEKEKIIGAIDVDHPISGDPLYEIGSLKWYHDDIFNRYNKNTQHSILEIKRILIYEIVHGVSVIFWMHKHDINILKELKKLKQLYFNFDDNLIRISDISL